MNSVNHFIFVLLHLSIWVVIFVSSEYAAIPPGHYYAGKAELRLHYTKDSPWRGKKEDSSIYKDGTTYKTPDYNTYMNKSGSKYADKSQYGSGRPGKGYIPVLGGYAGGINLQQPKYGSLYNTNTVNIPYGQPGYKSKARTIDELGEPGNTTTSTMAPLLDTSTADTNSTEAVDVKQLLSAIVPF